ncbi:MAG: sialate O-acetylesterase [Prevotella sp.]|nr:sialate O-acetylesterase [Prevotella sp.]
MKQKLFMTMAMLMCMVLAQAKVRMPQLFQDGMVLQRGVDIPVWGWADKGEEVAVSLLDAKGKVLSTAAATADDEGRWRVTLPKNKKMKAGGGYTMSVECGVKSAVFATAMGSDTVANAQLIKDVSLGDVWLLSGQSNIDVTIERVYPWYVKEIDAFDNPQVRLFRVQNETSTHGVKDDIRPTQINWKPLNKQNAWLFSAVGSFLGQRMQQQTGVPQGIIVNSWGGTPIEAWISSDSLMTDYPMLIKRVAFFQNDNYVRAQSQANGEAGRQWNELLDKEDQVRAYPLPAYEDADWKTIDQNSWSWRGTGSVWLRQHIQIDKEHAGKPARLLLGTLYDQDVTYLNGKRIGSTGYQYPPRRYDISEGLLQEGDNVIAIRFINKNGAVHFIPEKPYMLCFGNDRFSQNPMPKDVIPLGTSWKFHVGAEMPPCPGGDVSLQNLPTTLYNAVLYPLAPYAISGVVWYQGESNTGNPAPYADYLKKLMGCWRSLWHNPQMPFVIVQLANYDGRQQTGFPRPITPQNEPVNSGWAQLREAQRTVAEADPCAESVVNIDLGETVDIHPLRKKEVAERVGLCFDKLVFGKRENLFPRAVAHEVKEGKVILTLDQPLRPGPLKYFELAGSDGRFHNAEATAEGTTITVSVPVGFPDETPAALRYAWKDNPLGVDAYSLEGLPLSPFERKLR